MKKRNGQVWTAVMWPGETEVYINKPGCSPSPQMAAGKCCHLMRCRWGYLMRLPDLVLLCPTTPVGTNRSVPISPSPRVQPCVYFSSLRQLACMHLCSFWCFKPFSDCYNTFFKIYVHVLFFKETSMKCQKMLKTKAQNQLTWVFVWKICI